MRLAELLLLGVACRTAEPEPGCSLPACDPLLIAPSWESDRASVETALAHAEPLQQLLLIEVLLMARPRDRSELCALVPVDSPAADHCLRLELRPHLFALATDGSGPSHGVWPPPPELDLAWQSLALPVELDCIEALRCLRELVELESRDGRADQARGLCQDAATLAGPCVAHVLDELVPGPQVDAAVATTATLRQTFPGLVGDSYAGLLWGLWTQQAQEDAPRPTAALATELPDEALPHLRLAWTWVMGGGTRAVAADPSVDARIAILEAAARLPTPAPPAIFLGGLEPRQPELVRWTAARLLGQLHPRELSGRQDPSALVSRRLLR